jgi:drug/metabolite transporter (DMT)-like permease
MLAFAGNSVLCRLALNYTSIDAASFTSIRLISGAVVLYAIVCIFHKKSTEKGNWISALALFSYAACFSFAYISLTAATGALLLFGSVQATMIGHGLLQGERLNKQQLFGLLLALCGLVALLLPGLSTPTPVGSALMLAAGVSWGVYSLRGKVAGNPTRVTAGNFKRAALFAALLSMLLVSHSNIDIIGVWYAIASGAVTSGLGYALWYSVMPALNSTNAATVQLSVPIIAAIGGIFVLGESITAQFVLASLTILGGIALVIMKRGGQQVASADAKQRHG